MATVKFWQEMAKASTVNGVDKMMLGKNETGETLYIDFDQAKEYLEITGELIDPVSPGTLADPANLPPAPAGQKRKFEPEPGYYTDGTTTFNVDSTKRYYFYWNGTTWSLKDMGALPTESKAQVIEVGNQLAPTSDAVAKEDYLNKSKVKVEVISVNKFNKNTAIKGKYLSNDQIITTNPNTYISADISVVGNASKKLTISGLPTVRNSYSYQFINESGSVVEYGFIPESAGEHATISYTSSTITGFRITVFSNKSGETNNLNSIQVEFGDTKTAYSQYKASATSLYDLEIQSTYAKKVATEPVFNNDITSKAYVDITMQGVVGYDLFRDSAFLFDLNNSEYEFIYSQGTPTTSSIGYIRPISKTGKLNKIGFYIGRNVNTAGVITATIGTVPSLGAFGVNAVTFLGSFTIQSSELPASGVVFKEISLPTSLNVNSGQNLVVLFDTPTAIPVFKNTASSPYSILYKTTGNPNQWSYGYRKSSGIYLAYENADTKQSLNAMVDNKVTDLQDTFKGLKIVTIGDSITYHANSWARQLFSKYGTDYINLAISGAKFMDYPDTVIDLNDNISFDSRNNTALNQLLRLAKKLTPVGQQISITNPFRGETFTVPTEFGVGTGEFTQPDLIVVAMGTNDTVYATKDELFNILSTPLNELDRTANMVTGMRFFTEYLMALCPNAQIIFSTPIQASWMGNRRYEVTRHKRDRIVENCGYYSIPVIDSFNESGISEKFEVQSSQGRYLSDGLHPDANGKKLMADFLGKRIKNILFN
ncbi:SGNH/GDSL hydrolase family protein [Sphingobacterium lactis]|uniref:GDSL-like Lipase/Acylhydrolase family protein n=1 Tax=Sphingobacterium lactis TaxID=797291 RepID=A0A1H6CSL0_9SPHI|nr:SGNH/GDSL hydrolase family protein [Sphingobacterium lactis]SEG75767.1 GDSL-like Lipase/Acylhydrolase family protein [Sphingobacterium lactis]